MKALAFLAVRNPLGDERPTLFPVLLNSGYEQSVLLLGPAPDLLGHSRGHRSINFLTFNSGQICTSFFKNRSFTSFTPNKLVNDLFLDNEV